MAANIGGVYIKEEGTPGTYDAPGVEHIIGCSSFSAQRGDQLASQNDRIRPWAQGERPAPAGSRWVDFSIAGQLRSREGSGGGATVEIAPLLRSAGFVVAGTTSYDTGRFPDTQASSLSIRVQETEGGNEYQFRGCRLGSFELSYTPEAGVTYSFTGHGCYHNTVPVGTPLDPTGHFTAGLPLMFCDSFSYWGTSSIEGISSFSLNYPISTVLRPGGGAGLANGFHHWPPHLQLNDDPTVSIECEMLAVGDLDVYGMYHDAAPLAGGSFHFAATSGELEVSFPAIIPGKPEVNHGNSPVTVTLPGNIFWNTVSDSDLNLTWS